MNKAVLSIFTVVLLLSNILLSYGYNPDPLQHEIPDRLQIAATAQVGEDNLVIQLQVTNLSAKPLRVEPHYNSFLVADGKYYYKGTNALETKLFSSGFLAAGQQRSGAIVFDALPKDVTGFKYQLNGLKLYDGKASPAKVIFNFNRVTGSNQVIVSMEQPKATDSAEVQLIQARVIPDSGLLPGDKTYLPLTYDQRLARFRAVSQEVDLSAFYVDMPNRVAQGQSFDLTLYLPTAFDPLDAVVVIGPYYAENLVKHSAGVFSGKVRMPENTPGGINIVDIYLREENNKRYKIEKLVTVF